MLESESGQWRKALSSLSRVKNSLYTFWLFTESDISTFILPNTTFGIFGAFSGPCLSTDQNPSVAEVLQRAPLVLLFNWSNLFVFTLANQRRPESIEEDLANKPWRPLASKRVSPEQTRRLMLFTIPFVLALGFTMDVSSETTLLFMLNWLYNDLRGGDELFRDVIIAFAFGLFNHGSLKLALPDATEISDRGYSWIAIISGIILTTMQVQDLKDQEGDSRRGRKTVPIVLGETISRWMIAIFVLFWSYFCASFWGLRPWVYGFPMLLGGLIAFRAIFWRNPAEDCRTWQLWGMWLAVLYFLPFVHYSYDL